MRWLIVEMTGTRTGFEVVKVDGREAPAYTLDLYAPPASLLRVCQREGGVNRSAAVAVLSSLALWLSGGVTRSDKSDGSDPSDRTRGFVAKPSKAAERG